MVVLLVANTGKGTMVDVSLFLVTAPVSKQSNIHWNRQSTLMLNFMHSLCVNMSDLHISNFKR